MLSYLLITYSLPHEPSSLQVEGPVNGRKEMVISHQDLTISWPREIWVLEVGSGGLFGFSSLFLTVQKFVGVKRSAHIESTGSLFCTINFKHFMVFHSFAKIGL